MDSTAQPKKSTTQNELMMKVTVKHHLDPDADSFIRKLTPELQQRFRKNIGELIASQDQWTSEQKVSMKNALDRTVLFLREEGDTGEITEQLAGYAEIIT